MNVATALSILDRPGVFNPHLQRFIEGTATTDDRNSNGMTIRALGQVCTVEDRVPLLFAHDFLKPIGLVRRTWVDLDSSYGPAFRFKAQIATGQLAWLSDIWAAIKRAELMCISLSASNLGHDGGDFHEWVLGEISICPKGANHRARIDRVQEIENATCILPGAPHPRRECVYWDTRKRLIA